MQLKKNYTSASYLRHQPLQKRLSPKLTCLQELRRLQNKLYFLPKKNKEKQSHKGLTEVLKEMQNLFKQSKKKKGGGEKP